MKESLIVTSARFLTSPRSGQSCSPYLNQLAGACRRPSTLKYDTEDPHWKLGLAPNRIQIDRFFVGEQIAIFMTPS